ncbi:hypothetical protein [Nocardia niwae]|uniref:Uncharacterized protein n=1 Tax=Nocardia niwae TaxID=626084 RepID=A0ABV2X808_9NOCA|nr:hypothetical protein [Nocardia niwae]
MPGVHRSGFPAGQREQELGAVVVRDAGQATGERDPVGVFAALMVVCPHR